MRDKDKFLAPKPMNQRRRRALIGKCWTALLPSTPSVVALQQPFPTTTTTTKMSDSSSLSSGLSSAPSEDESHLELTKKDGILKFFNKAPGLAPQPKVEASPPRPKRDPSPPHEYVLADNPDIAVCIWIFQHLI
jgi:hypothetical protein